MPGPSRTRTRSPASTARTRPSAASWRSRRRSTTWTPWPRPACRSSTPAAASTPGSKARPRVAEKRYKELGGRMTVIVDEGRGHYPDRPEGPEAGRGIHPRPARSEPPSQASAQPRGLSVRPDDLARGAGELPVAGDLDGGPAQRPGRPRRQHPDAQGHRRQVHRPEPLPLGRRGEPAPQPGAGAGSRSPRSTRPTRR